MKELADIEYEEMDLEWALKLAFCLLANAYKIWEMSGVEERTRLLKMLFPDGL